MRNKKPYVTKYILDLIGKKNYYYKQLKKFPNSCIFKDQYKSMRNKLSNGIKYQKRQFYTAQIQNSIDNPIKLWGIYNKAL